MPLFTLQLPNSILKALRLPQNNPRSQQLRVLKKLLKKARFTEFGQQYRFDEILLSKHVGKKFQEQVPVSNYDSIYKAWWHKTMAGTPNVCWPGKFGIMHSVVAPVRRPVNFSQLQLICCVGIKLP